MTVKTAGTLLTTTGLAMFALTSAAAAQEKPKEDATEQAQTVLTGDKESDTKSATSGKSADDDRKVVSGQGGRLEGDIVVTGLRENVKTARTAKRRAQQIVDVIVAQDIGRLPDRNVPESLARVPGIQIDRSRGDGSDVRIRGLGGVMTTVNGSPTFSAGDRTAYLQDISSDLVGAIEVFKTRTPDQVEGSQTGVINISLRRPTDFKPGTTLAVNLTGDYPDQVKKVNPYGSILFVQNFDTDMGKFGFSLNATYTGLSYLESNRWNGIPRQLSDSRQIVQPDTLPAGVIMPEQVGFTYRRGDKKVGEIRFSSNYRPNDKLQLIMEGGFSKQTMNWQDDQFNIPILFSSDNGPPPMLTNVKLAPDGRVVASASVNSLSPFGPGKQSYLHQTRNYSARVEVDYKDDVVDYTGWFNYVRSNNFSNNLFHYTRFNQLPSVDVEFNTDKDPRGGQNVTFKGIDLTDPANYLYIAGYNQRREYTLSAETELRSDLRLNTGLNFIDWFKTGFRFASRNYDRAAGSRNQDGLRVPISALSGYDLEPVGKGFAGTATSSNANWLSGSGANFRDNWDTFRSLIRSISPAAINIDSYYPNYNRPDGFTGNDSSLSFYGMLHYNVNLLFPVEGVMGARVVNSLTRLTAASVLSTQGLVDGRPGTITNVTTVQSNGNYLNVLPSMNAIMHFTDKLQLRAAWTKDFGRPSAIDLNPYVNIDATNLARPTARAGNDALKAIDITKYDLSLEWYFGKTGTLSLAAWRWEQDGFTYRRTTSEFLPGFDVPVLVDRLYNGGRGRHKGVELAATSFFSFLPGILSSFGASANFTYNDTKQAYPTFNADGTTTGVFVYGPYLQVSKYLYNVIGFFERGGLNVRVAYNWRSRYENAISTQNFYSNQFFAPVERLDAAINYDINKNLTIALQANNLTRSGTNLFWGSTALPRDIYYFSRNYNASVRFRF